MFPTVYQNVPHSICTHSTLCMSPTVLIASVPHSAPPQYIKCSPRYPHVPHGIYPHVPDVSKNRECIYTVGNIVYTVGNVPWGTTVGNVPWGTYIYTVGNMSIWGYYIPWGTFNVPHGICSCSPRYIPHSIYRGYTVGTYTVGNDHIYCGSMYNILWVTWYIPWGTTVGHIPYIPCGTLKCSNVPHGISACLPRYVVHGIYR